MLDLDPYGGADLLGMFPLSFTRTADVMAPCHSVVFRWLVRLGSFLPCWRQANATPIPKGPPSSSVANYRPISITSVLSTVFEHLVSVRLGRFMERNGVLPITQFDYRKGLGICDALLCVSHTLQSALESGQEARIVQIDFSAAFGRVNHQVILYRLWSVGIGGLVLSILTQFLSNRSQHVMVDGCRSKRVDISGVPQGSVLGQLLFLLYTSQLFSILENKLIGYVDDSSLMGIVPSPSVRVTVAESLIRDLGRVSGCFCRCDLWGIKLNASKTKTMIVSRSSTMHPQSPPLTIVGTVLKESDDVIF